MISADMDVTDSLFELLVDVEAHAGVDFSGTGVIVSTRPQELPILPLCTVSDFSEAPDVADVLATISNRAHQHHDGFHVLGPDLRLLRVAQYFSPPIVPSAPIDRSKRFGGRYLAALFGSALPGVLATGIASRDFGIAVFREGRETAYRRVDLVAVPADKARAP